MNTCARASVGENNLFSLTIIHFEMCAQTFIKNIEWEGLHEKMEISSVAYEIGFLTDFKDKLTINLELLIVIRCTNYYGAILFTTSDNSILLRTIH